MFFILLLIPLTFTVIMVYCLFFLIVTCFLFWSFFLGSHISQGLFLYLWAQMPLSFYPGVDVVWCGSGFSGSGVFFSVSSLLVGVLALVLSFGALVFVVTYWVSSF